MKEKVTASRLFSLGFKVKENSETLSRDLNYTGKGYTNYTVTVLKLQRKRHLNENG